MILFAVACAASLACVAASVERVRKVSNTRRLMALSRLLTTMHEVDMTAWDGSKKLVIDTLDAELARLKKDDPNFDAKVKGSG